MKPIRKADVKCRIVHAVITVVLCTVLVSAADTIVEYTAPAGTPSALPPSPFTDAQFLYQYYVPKADDPQQNKLYYRIFVPPSYASSGTAKHPLVFFLHGDGEIENSASPRNQLQLRNNGQYVFCMDSNQAIFPCFFILVQSSWWGRDPAAQTAVDLTAALAVKYRIDPDRVFVTGLSGGGGGTQCWVGQRPANWTGWVALSAPTPQNIGSFQPANLALVPSWLFGSEGDSIDCNNFLAATLRAFGAGTINTRYSNGGHTGSTWSAAYATPALIPWLAGLRRGQAVSRPVEIAFTAPTTNAEYITSSSTIAPAGTVVDRSLAGVSSGITSVTWSVGGGGQQPAGGIAAWSANTPQTLPSGRRYVSATAVGTSWSAARGGVTYHSRILCTERTGASGAELDISSGGTAVSDGAKISVNGTAKSTATVVDYLLENHGSGTLTITTPVTVSSPSGCAVTVTAQPAGSIAPGASSVMSLQVIPSAAGPWQCQLSIANADGDENPYNWTLTGTAALTPSTPSPEIGISRSGAGTVADGGSDTVNGTVKGVQTNITYILTNSGTAPLAVTTPVHIDSANNCTAGVTVQPAASVAAGAGTAFSLAVTPAAAGAWSCIITITNTDSDEGNYNWMIGGTASNDPGPAVSASVTSITTNKQFTVALTTTENYGYFSTNGSAYAAYTTAGTNLTISGTTTLSIYGRDTPGNCSTTNTFVYTFDTNAPAVSGAPVNCTTNAAFSVSLAVNENYGYWSTNGSAFTQFSTAGAAIPVGTTTTLSYYGRDALGNTSATNTRVYTMLKVPSVTGVPAGMVTNKPFTIMLGVDENYGYFSTNNSPFTQFTTGGVSIPITGTTTLRCFGSNTSGSGAMITRTYTFDTTAPAVTGAPESLRTNRAVTVKLSVNENFGYVSVNGGAYGRFTMAGTNIVVGTTATVSYYGCDALGNTSMTNSRTYTVAVITGLGNVTVVADTAGFLFMNVPEHTTGGVYSVSGHYVAGLAVTDRGLVWDRMTSGGKRAAPGVYIYKLISPVETKIGKVMVRR